MALNSAAIAFRSSAGKSASFATPRCLRAAGRARPRTARRSRPARRCRTSAPGGGTRPRRSARPGDRLARPSATVVVEADVEDRVHHAGHRELGARAARHQQRDCWASPKRLPVGLLEPGERREHLRPTARRGSGRRVEVRLARLGGDDEAGRHRQPELVISARLAPLPPSRTFIVALPSSKRYTHLARAAVLVFEGARRTRRSAGRRAGLDRRGMRDSRQRGGRQASMQAGRLDARPAWPRAGAGRLWTGGARAVLMHVKRARSVGRYTASQASRGSEIRLPSAPRARAGQAANAGTM